jgi:hypothetical protein
VIERSLVTMGDRHLTILADDDPGTVVASGGYGSGKTTLGVSWTVKLGLEHGQDGPILGTEPSYPMVRDVMERTTMECLDRWRLPYRHWVSDHIFEIGRKKRFEFWCRSLDKPRSVEGINAIGLWADEWELCDPSALIPALQRVRAGTALRSLLTGTPEGYGPAYDMLLAKPSPTTRAYIIRTADNPFLPASYVEESKTRLGTDEAISEKLNGVRTARGGRVYGRFDRHVHGVPCVMPGHGEIQIACDFNVFGMHWLVVEVNHGTRRVHVLGELVGGAKTPTTTDAHAEKMIDYIVDLLNARGERVTRREVREMRIKAFCDASGSARSAVTAQTHVTLLQQAGFTPMHGAANPPIVDRVNDVQVMLRDQRLTVDLDGAPGMVATFEQQPYDGDSPSKKGLDHAADAIGYLIHWQFPTERPKPNAPLAGRALRVAQRYAPRTAPRGGLD